MTEYRIVDAGQIRILQYKFIETKRPIFFFLKERKRETWLDVPVPYVDTIGGHDILEILHGTANSTNTDLEAFMKQWPNVYDYLSNIYGPQQYLLQEEQRRFYESLREKKEYKYKH